MLGETLRTRRLQRGLDLADAAAELGVPAKSLRALEWDRPDLLESQGEADLIERRYAAFLGLEPGAPAAEAPAKGEAPARAEALATAEAPAVVAVPPSPPRPRRALWLPLLAALAPAVVIGVVYILGKVDDEESAGEVDRQPRASSIITTPDAGVTATSEQAPARAPRRRVNLVLIADRGASWVEAHSDSAVGPVLFEGTLEPGRELRLAGRRIWLRLGAASNLSLVVNGRPAPTELFGTVDVLVTPQGIRPASLGD